MDNNTDKKITHKSKDSKDKYGYRLAHKHPKQNYRTHNVAVQFYDPYTSTWRDSILRRSEVEPIGLI